MKSTVLFLSCLILGASIAVDINPNDFKLTSNLNPDQFKKLSSAIGNLLEWIANRLMDLSKLEERVSRLEEKAGNTPFHFSFMTNSSNL